jgi:DNA-binding transcriptional ArsR family regulator
LYDGGVRALYEPSRDDLALPNVLHALSDPIRLEILQRLTVGEQVCGTFGLPIAKSTLSHHFKLLREAGITHTRVEGVRRLISVRRDDLDARFPGLLDAVLAASNETGRRSA